MFLDNSAPLQPFKPMGLVGNPHAQMVAGYVFNRLRPKRESKLLTVVLSDGDRLAVLVDAPEGTPPRAGVVLLHGLGGDAGAKYMQSAACRLTENGYLVFRLNCRGAGEGAGMIRKLYHVGLSIDVQETLATLIKSFPSLQFLVVGFSMSGNTVLKYAGEAGDDAPKQLCGVIAVNPALDLERCVHSLSQSVNRMYERRFVKLLLKQLSENRPNLVLPESNDPIDSIRAYDDAITARLWGFENAEAYYWRESATLSIPNIAVPTIVLTSDDDPLIPVHIFSDVRWPDGTRLHVTRGGGHMGYVAAKKTPLGDRRWLDYYLVHAANILFRDTP